MKTLYISDLDGTLLDRKARLTKRSEKIIKGLINEGMLFSVATARSISSIDILSRLEMNVPCVQLNGVLIYDFQKRKYIDCEPVDDAAAKDIIKILRYFERMSFVYKLDSDSKINVEFEHLENNVEIEFFNSRKNDYKSFRCVEKVTTDCDNRVIYFTMVDEYQRLLPIYEEIKKLPLAEAVLYKDNYSNMYFLEIFGSNATKANGVAKIKKIVGADCVVAFGDNLNDIDMLKTADVGIAVGNCAETVKKYADKIIGNSYEDGVAEYLLSEYSRTSASGGMT